MTSPEDILRSGYDAHQASDHRYAALRFCQAAETARLYADEERWFTATVWWAESLLELGDIRGAFYAVLTARAEEPPGTDFDHWLCRKLLFKIGLAWEPLRSKLEGTLADLDAFSKKGTFADQDLHVLRGELAASRGQWEEALIQFERAASVFKSSAPGATLFSAAYQAVECCLSLQMLSAAEDWIERINQREEWDGGWEKAIRIRMASARLKLSRARHEPYSELHALLRELDNLCIGVDHKDISEDIREQRARIELLNLFGGDPARPMHPSRVECRKFSLHEKDCHVVWKNTLLVLDYRLASRPLKK